jgi:20S proteasome subunit beta 3
MLLNKPLICYKLYQHFCQSIFSYNGGACLAMTGDGCFAIATDLRYGQELKTVTTDFPKAFEMAPNLWMGLTGLATDVQTVQQKMEFRKQMYELTENRKMKPQVKRFSQQRI